MNGAQVLVTNRMCQRSNVLHHISLQNIQLLVCGIMQAPHLCVEQLIAIKHPGYMRGPAVPKKLNLCDDLAKQSNATRQLLGVDNTTTTWRLQR